MVLVHYLDRYNNKTALFAFMHMCVCMYGHTCVCLEGHVGVCICIYRYIKMHIYAHTTGVAYLWHIFSSACTTAHVSHRQQLSRNRKRLLRAIKGIYVLESEKQISTSFYTFFNQSVVLNISELAVYRISVT